MLYFYFYLSLKYIIISLIWPIGYLRVGCLIFTYLSFRYWILVTFHCGQRRYLIWFQSLKNFWDMFCGLTCGLSWRMLHVHLGRMHILLLLSRVFCICLLGLLVYSVVQVLYYLTNLLSWCSIYYWKWGTEVFNYYSRIICFSLQFCSFCFIYFGALLLAAYSFIIVIFSWLTLSSIYSVLCFL